eukprot:COSAG01_NODE_10431_length_2167_cov_8.562863_3_plen_176_part_00
MLATRLPSRPVSTVRGSGISPRIGPPLPATAVAAATATAHHRHQRHQHQQARCVVVPPMARRRQSGQAEPRSAGAAARPSRTLSQPCPWAADLRVASAPTGLWKVDPRRGVRCRFRRQSATEQRAVGFDRTWPIAGSDQNTEGSLRSIEIPSRRSKSVSWVTHSASPLGANTRCG